MSCASVERKRGWIESACDVGGHQEREIGLAGRPIEIGRRIEGKGGEREISWIAKAVKTLGGMDEEGGAMNARWGRQEVTEKNKEAAGDD
jgi:hypothetical protein